MGDRFDPDRVLSDPYARVIGGRAEWGVQPDYFNPYVYRSRLPLEDFDWEGDRPLRTPLRGPGHLRDARARLHPAPVVRSATLPGTFAGLREKIPYLKELGVNCVELMPIFEFDECENSPGRPDDRRAGC